jgi:hypothetical protein
MKEITTSLYLSRYLVKVENSRQEKIYLFVVKETVALKYC